MPAKARIRRARSRSGVPSVGVDRIGEGKQLSPKPGRTTDRRRAQLVRRGAPERRDTKEKAQQRAAMVSLSLLVKQSKSDGTAAMALSQRRLYGIGCKPDRRAAFNAVRLAAHLGHPDGRRARIYLTAAGIGTKPDHSA